MHSTLLLFAFCNTYTTQASSYLAAMFWWDVHRQMIARCAGSLKRRKIEGHMIFLLGAWGSDSCMIASGSDLIVWDTLKLTTSQMESLEDDGDDSCRYKANTHRVLWLDQLCLSNSGPLCLWRYSLADMGCQVEDAIIEGNDWTFPSTMMRSHRNTPKYHHNCDGLSRVLCGILLAPLYQTAAEN
jgi:hypothetical protein